MEDYGKMDLSGYRDEVLFLETIGVRSQAGLIYGVSFFIDGVKVMYSDGSKGYADTPNKVRMKKKGNVKCISVTGEPYMKVFLEEGRYKIYAIDSDSIDVLSNLQKYVLSNCSIESLMHNLSGCLQSYEFQERLHDKVAKIKVKQNTTGKWKI